MWPFKDKTAIASIGKTFAGHPHLLALKPKEGYLFRSDYFEVDDQVGCVLGYFHDESAQDRFGPFWGINRIPTGMPDGVTTVLLEQVARRGEGWIEEHLTKNDRLEGMKEAELANSSTSRARRAGAKVSDDLDIISAEIVNGASYLHVHNRLLVKAPSLVVLEQALDHIASLYIDRFATLHVAPYPGEQRRELSGLLRSNESKRGKGFDFTSSELAGAYSLVTHGLSDPTGEPVGHMVGDVNTPMIIVDMNKYNHHVVVADKSVETNLNRAPIADLWGSKISQSCLLNNGRVIHLIFDGVNLNNIGPKLESLTTRLDLSKGDVNMFEFFGDKDDEVSLMSAQVEKLQLMLEQIKPPTPTDRDMVRQQLSTAILSFYVDQRMWDFSPLANRDKLRLVGIPHSDVPKLEMFVNYVAYEYEKLKRSTARDEEALHAASVLNMTYRNLMDTCGDLFNVTTSSSVDGVRSGRRVVYDFSSLARRGEGLAMAQLVNVIGYATDTLGAGDTVIIHGTENIGVTVKPYITQQFDRLYSRGGRVAFLYNDVDKMLADSEFNQIESADYTVLGPMKTATVQTYQKVLSQRIPSGLEQLLSQQGEPLNYFRRGVDNVVFYRDLLLGINPNRKKVKRLKEGLK